MQTHIRWAVAVLLAVGAIALGGPLRAQSGQKFTGRVQDATGAVIPQATVTITNESTKEANVQHTTGSGDYAVPYLIPGQYTISVTKAGFKTVVKEHITLNTDQSSNIDFDLPAGSEDMYVTVTADQQQLETSKADRGEIIGLERVNELPIDSRNPLVLFGLSPGTLNRSQEQYPRPFDNVNQNLYSNGSNQTASGNIDGATNDNQSNFNGYVPSLDSVQEFKVVLNEYDAQYGRSGGSAIDITLKTGTNSIHGDTYYFMRRRWLDANAWQNNYNNIVRPDHTRDQYGFELDGPVVLPKIYNGREKTFFLMQYEQLIDNLPRTSTAVNSIPPAAWLTGNFSGATYYNSVDKQLEPLIIYDPLSPLVPFVDKDGKTKMAHSAFPGNVIPQNRLDPVGLAMASYYANITPNATPGPGFAPYQNNLYWLPVEYDVYRTA